MLDCARAQKSGFQAVLAGITMHTIGLIYSINKNQDYGSVSMQKIQEACVLMRENIYDKFTPEDIAESINMSYSNFRKSFKQYTGIAPPSIHAATEAQQDQRFTEQYGNVDPRHRNEAQF